MKSICILIVLTFFVIPVFAEQNINQFIRFEEFELEKTKLKEIISVLGKTLIYKEGDAAESYTGICYYYPKQNITVFYESGEMGGSTTLLSYKFYNGYKTRFPCKTIHDAGNTKFTKDAISILPKKTHSMKGRSYAYWNKIPFTKQDIVRTDLKFSDNMVWDEMVTIDLYEKEGFLTGFGISRVITW